MKNSIMSIKKIIESLPEEIGRKLVVFPYSLRLGKEYKNNHNKANLYETKDYQYTDEIIQQLKYIIIYAYNNIPFYKSIYDRILSIEEMITFETFKKLPIITREQLQNIDINLRSNQNHAFMHLNTGGTSGKPLNFYIDKNAFSREWAHMHFIWEKLGYNRFDKKVTFRGKNISPDHIKYNAIHNEYIVNSYSDYKNIAEVLKSIMKKERISYLHGYPSLIYDFIKYCYDMEKKLLELFKLQLKGIFFGSEYPAPVYRDTIEDILNVPTISWYGHSEMTVLAYEIDRYKYKPMYSYGYCEAIKTESNEFHLVGTSYYNTASPFIRYDTGDIIIPEYQNEILTSFLISSGRVGDFIVDKRGKNISLTALVFGRHHKVFEWARFVQVEQEKKGKAVIWVTVSKSNSKKIEDLKRDFDVKDIAIDFDYKIINEPIKSARGKVQLLIK